MKAVVLAIAVLFASVSAVPQPLDAKAQRDQRIVDDILMSLLEDLRTRIIERGLDPYDLVYAEGSWGLPVPGIFDVWGYGQGVGLIGLSGFVVNGVSYNLLTGALRLDISLPELSGSVASAGGTVTVLGNTIEGSGNGWITVTGVRVVGDAVVNIGLAGVTVDSLDVVASIENISSDITVVIQDRDLSSYINAFFNDILLRYLEQYADEINQLLSHYGLRYINHRLSV